jgi:histidinol-phosphate/aromatic aminotransferase/cobyric acid decarboxylase-like protein
MSDNSSRRQWLRNTTAALAGVSLAPAIFATEKERYRAAGIILLNGNENAYGPSAAARKAMAEVTGNSNRYPDDQDISIKKTNSRILEHWNGEYFIRSRFIRISRTRVFTCFIK